MTEADSTESKNTSLYLPKFCIVPLAARQDDSISNAAKIYLGEINVLTNKFGYCTASDEALAEMKSVTTRTIKNWHKELEAAGFIYRHTWREHYKNPKGTGVLVRSRRKLYVIEEPSNKVAEGKLSSPHCEGKKVSLRNKELLSKESLEEEKISKEIQSETTTLTDVSSDTRSTTSQSKAQDKITEPPEPPPNAARNDSKAPPRAKQGVTGTDSHFEKDRPVQAKSGGFDKSSPLFQDLLKLLGLTNAQSVVMQAARREYDLTNVVEYVKNNIDTIDSPIAKIRAAIRDNSTYENTEKVHPKSKSKRKKTRAKKLDIKAPKEHIVRQVDTNWEPHWIKNKK